MDLCPGCGDPVPQARKGPTRVWCSGKCRMRGMRARNVAATRVPAPDPVPPAPDGSPAQLVLQASAPVAEQLTAALAATMSARRTLQQVAGRLPDNLAWRATETSQRLDVTLAQVWGIGG